MSPTKTKDPQLFDPRLGFGYGGYGYGGFGGQLDDKRARMFTGIGAAENGTRKFISAASNLANFLTGTNMQSGIRPSELDQAMRNHWSFQSPSKRKQTLEEATQSHHNKPDLNLAEDLARQANPEQTPNRILGDMDLADPKLAGISVDQQIEAIMGQDHLQASVEALESRAPMERDKQAEDRTRDFPDRDREL